MYDSPRLSSKTRPFSILPITCKNSVTGDQQNGCLSAFCVRDATRCLLADNLEGDDLRLLKTND
jgi:hypothetical protein